MKRSLLAAVLPPIPTRPQMLAGIPQAIARSTSSPFDIERTPPEGMEPAVGPRAAQVAAQLESGRLDTQSESSYSVRPPRTLSRDAIPRAQTVAGPAPLPRLPARMPRASTAPIAGAPPMRTSTSPAMHPYAAPITHPRVPRPAQVFGPMPAPNRASQTQVRMPPGIPQQHLVVRGQRCEVCSAVVGELRRGRCWGCYSRWVETRPVGLGARCVTCGEKRRRVLKNVELYGGWKPMCFNCAGQLLHLDPLPPTIAALRVAVSRERRGTDRRVGKADTRVFQYERRVGERRVGREDEQAASAIVHEDDDLVIEITVEPLVASASGTNTDDGVDFDDLTQIRELVRELRPE